MRKRLFQAIFCIGTALNILMLCHIHTYGILRAGISENYITEFGIWDIPLLGLLSAFCFVILKFAGRLLGTLKIRKAEKPAGKFFGTKIFMLIFLCWFFFLLALYPGTAMNDTINICENPSFLTNQHPAMYVYFTYGFYKLGVMLGSPNLGLAFISFFQLVWMDYVVTYGIRILRTKGVPAILCVVLACYFGISPIFGIYALSAIKDTPFAIAVFWLMILMYEASDTKGAVLEKRSYQIRIGICTFVMAGFRSNGVVIAVGTGLVVVMIYRKYRRQLATIFVTAIVTAIFVNSALVPDNVEKLFQEKVGIPIQQVAAVINKGGEVTPEQEEYLFRLLPKEKWLEYGTGCVDNLKWDSEFDGGYLNDTKFEFIKTWLELMPQNKDLYWEAYVLSTYGIWGIETRNREQYYVKNIYNNNIGLYQESLLPDKVENYFCNYYCNRFICGYLSEGTAFWMMFGICLLLIYKRQYTKAVVYAPMAMNFVTLMLAAPVAFAFRYVFTLALAVPFMIITAIWDERVWEEEFFQEEDWQVGGCA